MYPLEKVAIGNYCFFFLLNLNFLKYNNNLENYFLSLFFPTQNSKIKFHLPYFNVSIQTILTTTSRRRHLSSSLFQMCWLFLDAIIKHIRRIRFTLLLQSSFQTTLYQTTKFEWRRLSTSVCCWWHVDIKVMIMNLF